MLNKLVIACGAVLLWVHCAHADPAREFRRSVEGGTHQSLTGQFIAHKAPLDGYPPLKLDKLTNVVRLEPELIVVSCERIKKALLNELGARDEWKGKIFIELHQANRPDEIVTIHSTLTDNKWVYHIQLPDVMDKYKFTAAMATATLLEMANRNSTRNAEIPAWLSEGFTTQIINATPGELVLESPRQNDGGWFLNRMLKDNRRIDPLLLAHEYLQIAPPLTVEQLSWPAPGQLEGDPAMIYRSSAQLFVDRLLRLKDGRAAMQQFVRELPQRLNWQLTFLTAFKAHFGSQLDLNKWWALQLSDFTGRNLSQVMDSAESWQKLDDILRPTVEVRVSGKDAPFRTQVSLETVITDWDKLRQTQLIQEKLQQLTVIGLRIDPQFVPLVEGYHKTLKDFLKHRDGLAFNPLNRNLYAPPFQSITDQTVKELRALDAQRDFLRTRSAAPPAITSNGRN